MKYVLDTNTVSYLMRGDESVCGRLTALARTDVLLPQPVIAEIEYGLARLAKSARKMRLRGRFEVLWAEMARCDWSDDVSRVFGEIKSGLERGGSRLEDFDIAVAAHARAIDATLVSDNAEHMSRIEGLRYESWRG
jgi:tRNA(fMet)-specific endonuclease VapC